jgi:hypothetical protein
MKGIPKSKPLSLIDVAKTMYLIGLQSEELAQTVGSKVDLEKAWRAMGTLTDVEYIMNHRDIFLGSLFEDKVLKNNKKL